MKRWGSYGAEEWFRGRWLKWWGWDKAKLESTLFSNQLTHVPHPPSSCRIWRIWYSNPKVCPDLINEESKGGAFTRVCFLMAPWWSFYGGGVYLPCNSAVLFGGLHWIFPKWICFASYHTGSGRGRGCFMKMVCGIMLLHIMKHCGFCWCLCGDLSNLLQGIVYLPSNSVLILRNIWDELCIVS